MDMFGPNTNRGRVPLETTRLKLPPVEASDNPTPLKLLGSQAAEAEETDCSKTDLLIQGLVDRLPKPNAVWSLEERAKWLRTAASIFGLGSEQFMAFERRTAGGGLERPRCRADIAARARSPGARPRREAGSRADRP